MTINGVESETAVVTRQWSGWAIAALPVGVVGVLARVFSGGAAGLLWTCALLCAVGLVLAVVGIVQCVRGRRGIVLATLGLLPALLGLSVTISWVQAGLM